MKIMASSCTRMRTGQNADNKCKNHHEPPGSSEGRPGFPDDITCACSNWPLSIRPLFLAMGELEVSCQVKGCSKVL